MKEEKIIHKLFSLGFKDESLYFDSPRFSLEVNNFSLCYEKGKFTLEGDGGRDHHGTLELESFKIKDIKPLYKLLTGKIVEEKIVSFNYKEWRIKLQKEKEARNKNIFTPELFTFTKESPIIYVDSLINNCNNNMDKFNWSEEVRLRHDPEKDQ
jgi:hypothetical protein